MIDLAELGITKEDLQERVIEKMADNLLSDYGCDEDGEPSRSHSSLRKNLDDKITECIDKSVEQIAEKHVLPKVAQLMEAVILQKTNQWGEKQGKPTTFIEYLIERADFYMTEEVDEQGKTRKESSYNFNPRQTRISHLIEKHLHYSIEKSMKAILQDGNKTLVKSIEETVRIQLKQLSEKICASVVIKDR